MGPVEIAVLGLLAPPAALFLFALFLILAEVFLWMLSNFSQEQWLYFIGAGAWLGLAAYIGTRREV